MKRKKRRKEKVTLQLTNDSKEYRMTKRRIDLGCTWCPPNKGCNRRRKNGAAYKNWKKYRKTQWR